MKARVLTRSGSRNPHARLKRRYPTAPVRREADRIESHRPRWNWTENFVSAAKWN